MKPEKINWITEDVIEDMPNLAVLEFDTKFADKDFTNLTYAGFCVVQYFDGNDLKYYKGKDKNFLEDSDKSLLKEWFHKEDSFYLDNYFRLDFQKYIYLFKEYEFEKGRILMGNLLNKNLELRLDLAGMHQKHLMRLLIHGRTKRYR